jgi:superfamily II DNA/RNA helicase
MRYKGINVSNEDRDLVLFELGSDLSPALILIATPGRVISYLTKTLGHMSRLRRSHYISGWKKQ